MRRKDRSERLGIGANITRRDFVNAALVGTGAALLTQCAPVQSNSAGTLLDSWTGYGGVGDYAAANGNTKTVMDVAHTAIRDSQLASYQDLIEDDEHYDVIVVGAGFAGLAAAYELKRDRGTKASCLILENHPIFGGNARENEFEVEGYRLLGPQASNDTIIPHSTHGPIYEYWRELGLPFEFDYAQPNGFDASGLKVATDNYMPMYWDESAASIGWIFDKPSETNKPSVIKDAFLNDLRDTPLSDKQRNELLQYRFGFNQSDLFSQHGRGFQSEDHWLDSMTYGQFIERILGLGESAKRFADPLIAVGDMGAGVDAISALAAKKLWLPGVSKFTSASPFENSEAFSFPGGNSTIARHFVKALIPDAFAGDDFATIAGGRLNFEALDNRSQPFRVRLNSLAVEVKNTHSGVEVYYLRDGRVHRAQAKSVVLAIEGHAAKRIVSDLPDNLRTAFSAFHHGPILTVNVALRNWRFLEKLGISGARWSEGFGFYGNIRRPMHFEGVQPPFHPEKPIVWTFYVPFTYPDVDASISGSFGRAEMLSKSFADYELEVRQQMDWMFSHAGFEANRDIAGIILNRWGHAYVSPQPGFFTGLDGSKVAPSETVRLGLGPIQFAHSELTGLQNWINATAEGRRAMRALIDAVL